MEDVYKKGDVLEVHIMSNKPIKLADLSRCLQMVNAGINDVLRDERGISNHRIREYGAEVVTVKEGSIIFELVISFLELLTMGIIIDAIINRLKEAFKNHEIEVFDYGIRINFGNAVFEVSIKKKR